MRKALPRPRPACAPGTNPATSLTSTGIRRQCSPSTSSDPCAGSHVPRSPAAAHGHGTGANARPTLGSIVVNGWGAHQAAPRSVSASSRAALKKVDLPADGLPTRPTTNVHRPPPAPTTNGASVPCARRSRVSASSASIVAASTSAGSVSSDSHHLPTSTSSSSASSSSSSPSPSSSLSSSTPSSSLGSPTVAKSPAATARLAAPSAHSRTSDTMENSAAPPPHASPASRAVASSPSRDMRSAISRGTPRKDVVGSAAGYSRGKISTSLGS